jgi:AmmeMemoRadiSam system protein A
VDVNRLGAADREALLSIARAAVEAAAEGRPPPRFDPSPGPLAEKRGAFVTLKKNGGLRGCLGRFEPDAPLAETVAEMARAAALDDPRFEPVSAGEAGEIEITVSVLGPLRRVRPEEVRLGIDGVRISCAGRSGCFLPQVARETGWDLETFLDRCAVEKAGLPPRRWRRTAEIEAFEVEEVVEPG